MKEEYTYTHYLAAKKSVDDRALNAHVQEALADAITGKENLSVLEVGAGIGTAVTGVLAARVKRTTAG